MREYQGQKMTTEDDKKNKSKGLNKKDFTPEEWETIKKLTPEDLKKISKRTLQMYELSMRARGMLGQKKTKH
jgi:hypothetical protein